ncbi:MAG TPA: c-type cytochrome [Thermoanaerobaculia bacterium]
MHRKLRAVVGLALALLTAAVIHAQMRPSHEATAAGQAPAVSQPSAVPAPAPPSGSVQGNPIAELERSIAGREKEPAGRVFKNVQILKEVPAGLLLDIMRTGFSRPLGVKCSYCHVVGSWEKEDKTEKQVARDMWKMTTTIDDELLKNIKNLKSDQPNVTCATCHRGQEKPATRMESPPKPADAAAPTKPAR